MKKFLSILLSIVMLLSITAGIDLSAYANLNDENFEFSINSDGTLNVSKYIGNSIFVDIPSEYYKRKVTTIGNSAFDECSSLVNVNIPNTITSVGEHAFYRCSSLTNIRIPDSVKFVGDAAFFECFSLTNVRLSNSLTSISDLLFAYCNELSEIIIPDNVFSIGSRAFICCSSLTNISIPNSVVNISEFAFAYCDSLINLSIPNNVKYIGESAFYKCDSLKFVNIGIGLSRISKSVFGSCHSLEKVFISKSIKSIDNDAFTESNKMQIYCYMDSIAHKFAQYKGIPVELLYCENHNYVLVDTTNSNCINYGKEKYLCQLCAEEKEVVLALSSHNFNNANCSVCGAANPAYVAPKSVTTKFPSGATKVNGEWINKKQKNTKIKKLTKGKKSFKATWSKVSGITGYQLQYSTSSKFTKKTTKSVTIKKNKTTSATVKKLKAKKKYYVRIRTYKNVKQNGKTVKVYSSWSKAMTVKTQ